jgi:uncharacterized membrane protein YphA (DoxX/SURF4 family)
MPGAWNQSGVLDDYVRVETAAVSTERWLPWAGTGARLVLAVVFAWAGVAKMSNPDAAVRAVRAYRILPEALVHPAAWGLPFVELAVAALLLFGIATRLAAAVGAGLLTAFMIAIASVWARGIQIDCGCFGGGGPAHAGAAQYLSELARDAVLLGLAIGLVVHPTSRFALLDLPDEP